MILQALTDYYRTLEEKGRIAPPGWSENKVSFALYVDAQGSLEQVVSLQTEQTKGKKKVLVPQIMRLPASIKRSSGIASNFLCDNSDYLLGVDSKGKPQRSVDCFWACAALHEQILADVDTPAARALLSFFRTWQPSKAATHPALKENWDEILSGGNLVFWYGGAYLHDDPQIRLAWERHYSSVADHNAPQMVCLVTGEKGPVESVHPSIMQLWKSRRKM